MPSLARTATGKKGQVKRKTSHRALQRALDTSDAAVRTGGDSLTPEAAGDRPCAPTRKDPGLTRRSENSKRASAGPSARLGAPSDRTGNCTPGEKKPTKPRPHGAEPVHSEMQKERPMQHQNVFRERQTQCAPVS